MDFDDAKLEQTDQTFMKRLRVQKQPFIDVLQNKCSYKLCNIDRKTPVSECLFNKVPTQVFSYKYCEIFL